MLDKGVNAYITSADETQTPCGKRYHMPVTGLFRRASALVLNAEVEGLVLVVQTDEVLDTGLPLEFVDKVTFVDQQLVPEKSRQDRLPADRIAILTRLLRTWKLH